MNSAHMISSSRTLYLSTFWAVELTAGIDNISKMSQRCSASSFIAFVKTLTGRCCSPCRNPGVRATLAPITPLTYIQMVMHNRPTLKELCKKGLYHLQLKPNYWRPIWRGLKKEWNWEWYVLLKVNEQLTHGSTLEIWFRMQEAALRFHMLT